ncbi:MAG: glycosyltransferase family 2 protein [Akkermansia sp.]
MMSEPLISVIVPVYKVEPYLRAALDSLVQQTLTDWEAVCVDDGSPDASGAILDEYAQADSRFRVIHQANGGVSRARNVALDAARGRYVTMMDPDDTLPPQALEALYRPMRDDPALEIVLGGYLCLSDGTTRPGAALNKGAEAFEGKVCDRAWIAAHSPGFSWGKLILRSLLEEHSFRFDTSYSHGEDMCFYMGLFMVARRFYVIRDVVYCYRVRLASATQAFHSGIESPQTYLHYCSTPELIAQIPASWSPDERRRYAQSLVFVFWYQWAYLLRSVAHIGRLMLFLRVALGSAYRCAVLARPLLGRREWLATASCCEGKALRDVPVWCRTPVRTLMYHLLRTLKYKIVH